MSVVALVFATPLLTHSAQGPPSVSLEELKATSAKLNALAADLFAFEAETASYSDSAISVSTALVLIGSPSHSPPVPTVKGRPTNYLLFHNQPNFKDPDRPRLASYQGDRNRCWIPQLE